MFRKLFSRLAVIMLLMTVWFSAFSVQSARADGPVYIRADGTVEPSTAPIQRNGNLYTLTGNIVSDADGIVVERDNIVLDGSGFAVEGAYLSQGIHLHERINVRIQNTNIKNFSYGIWLSSSSNNRINGNNITDNQYDGIWFLVHASNNSISGNNTINNGFGIRLDSFSNYNSIRGNNISDNSDHGIGFYSSSNNSIDVNNITGNFNDILLVESSNNTVCHNNFISSTVKNWTPENADFWDNKCEGNFWSDYNGADLDNDGIGDTLLPWEGRDNYPLMNVYWNPCDINHDLNVNMTDIGYSAKAFATVPGDTWWNPHSDITGSEPFAPDGTVDMRDISLVAKHFGERRS